MSKVASSEEGVISDPAIAALVRVTRPVNVDDPDSNTFELAAGDPQKASQLLAVLRSRFDQIRTQLGIPCGATVVLGGDTYACKCRMLQRATSTATNTVPYSSYN